jgi:Rad3-related DNA helicase
VVLTSATLAVDGKFEHASRKFGLPGDAHEDLALDSPFALDRQVAAWVVTGMPEPTEADFAQALARGIALLARKVRRKMLVLFTSHDALRKVEAALREPLEDRGVRLLAQGVDGGRRQVRAGFQETGPAVLLGTASFWEGVDFPGEELEVLVMARLPFLVPTDPLVEAMTEKLRAEGLDPFRTFYLPEALIRFRQGFGRLIRRAEDRGLFVVVDSRLDSRSYGTLFKKHAGVTFRSAADWEELAQAGSAWFGGESTEPSGA